MMTAAATEPQLLAFFSQNQKARREFSSRHDLRAGTFHTEQ
jgi:hypothetical protein